MTMILTILSVYFTYSSIQFLWKNIHGEFMPEMDIFLCALSLLGFSARISQHVQKGQHEELFWDGISLISFTQVMVLVNSYSGTTHDESSLEVLGMTLLTSKRAYSTAISGETSIKVLGYAHALPWFKNFVILTAQELRRAFLHSPRE